eukprot:3132280-Rhodomonas_salina.1
MCECVSKTTCTVASRSNEQLASARSQTPGLGVQERGFALADSHLREGVEALGSDEALKEAEERARQQLPVGVGAEH